MLSHKGHTLATLKDGCVQQFSNRKHDATQQRVSLGEPSPLPRNISLDLPYLRSVPNNTTKTHQLKNRNAVMCISPDVTRPSPPARIPMSHVTDNASPHYLSQFFASLVELYTVILTTENKKLATNSLQFTHHYTDDSSNVYHKV